MIGMDERRMRMNTFLHARKQAFVRQFGSHMIDWDADEYGADKIARVLSHLDWIEDSLLVVPLHLDGARMSTPLCEYSLSISHPHDSYCKQCEAKSRFFLSTEEAAETLLGRYQSVWPCCRQRLKDDRGDEPPPTKRRRLD